MAQDSAVENPLRELKKRFIRACDFLDKEEGHPDKDTFGYPSSKGSSGEVEYVEYDFDQSPEKVTKKVFSLSGQQIGETEDLDSVEKISAEAQAMAKERVEKMNAEGKSGIEEIIDKIARLFDISKGEEEVKEEAIELDEIVLSLEDEPITATRVISEESSLSLEKQNELNKKFFDAVSNNSPLEVIQELYDQGAQVNTIFSVSEKAGELDYETKTTPLSKAVENGNHEVAKFLLEQRADPNVRGTCCGPKGMDPLHMAAIRGDDEFVKMLLENGAKTDVEEHEGWDFSPLESLLLHCGKEDDRDPEKLKNCFKLFEERGFDVRGFAEEFAEELGFDDEDKEVLDGLLSSCKRFESKPPLDNSLDKKKAKPLDKTKPSDTESLGNKKPGKLSQEEKDREIEERLKRRLERHQRFKEKPNESESYQGRFLEAATAVMESFAGAIAKGALVIAEQANPGVTESYKSSKKMLKNAPNDKGISGSSEKISRNAPNNTSGQGR